MEAVVNNEHPTLATLNRVYQRRNKNLTAYQFCFLNGFINFNLANNVSFKDCNPPGLSTKKTMYHSGGRYE